MLGEEDLPPYRRMFLGMELCFYIACKRTIAERNGRAFNEVRQQRVAGDIEFDETVKEKHRACKTIDD